MLRDILKCRKNFVDFPYEVYVLFLQNLIK